VWNLASHTKVRTQSESDVEQGAEQDILDEGAWEWRRIHSEEVHDIMICTRRQILLR
jgi:hypothetical protein